MSDTKENTRKGLGKLHWLVSDESTSCTATTVTKLILPFTTIDYAVEGTTTHWTLNHKLAVEILWHGYFTRTCT